MNINRSFFTGGLMTVDMGNALPTPGLKVYDVLAEMPDGYCSDMFGGATTSPSHQSPQNSAAQKMQEVREKGQSGEAAVGYEKNTQRIPSLTKTAAYRIPDILTDSFVGEVKNYSRPVRLTPQIVDEILYADQENLIFILFTDATLAPTLQQLLDNNVIVVKPIYK